MLIFFLTLLYFFALFVVIEVVSRKKSVSVEITRKLVHIIAGISAASLPLILSFNEIILLSLLFIPVMLYSKKVNLFRSIHSVKRKTLGEVYFPFAILLTALFFPDKTVYTYGILIMAISDGFASIVGQKYGKHKYRVFSGWKTKEGSLTFFLCSVVIGVVMMVTLGMPLVPALIFCSILALVLTIVEGCLSSGLDNLLLPPLSSALFITLFDFFYG